MSGGLAAVLLGTILLAGCATWPRSWVVSDAQMSATLARQLPMPMRWLEVLDLQWSAPRVRAIAPHNRLRTEVDLLLGDRVFKSGFTARAVLEAKVRFEPSDHSLRLSEVTVEAFTLDEASGVAARMVRLPAAMVAQWFEDATVYRLGADQIERLRREGLTVRDVVAVDGGLQFTLGSVR